MNMKKRQSFLQANESAIIEIYRQSNLTQNQILIWLGHKLHFHKPFYNNAVIFTFSKPIIVENFQKAWELLVNSSDTLRTIIEEINGIPQQKVLDNINYDLKYLDFSQFLEPELKLKEWINKHFQSPLDLEKCLFDTALIKLSEHKFAWYLCQDQIMGDGIALALIYEKVLTIYNNLPKYKNLQKLEIPQFKDYIEYEKAYRNSPQYLKDKVYWQNFLAQQFEPVSFYGRRNLKQTINVHRVSFNLGINRSKKISNLILEDKSEAKDKMSIFNFLLAVLIIYLYRITNNKKLVIGISSHNRRLKKFRQTIGSFMQIVPLPIEIREGETIPSLIKQISLKTFEIFKYGRYVTNNPLNQPIYDVVFNYHPVDYFYAKGSTPKSIPSGYGNESLTIRVEDFGTSGSFSFDFDFNCHVFPEKFRSLTIQHFRQTLDSCLNDTSQLVDCVNLLSPQEKESLLSKFSQSKGDFDQDKCIHQLFEKQVENNPDAIAVVYKQRQLTYKQLNEKANQLAHYLQKLGVQAETIVGIYLEKSLEMMVAVLGILKAGGAYLPIDSNYPSQRIAYMLEDAGVSVLLTEESLLPSLPENKCQIISWQRDGQLIANMSRENLVTNIDSHNLAYVIYTSGSTGKSKGVEITHQNLVNIYYGWEKDYELKTRVRSHLQMANFAFDVFTGDWVRALASGGKLVLCPPEYLLEAEKLYSLLFAEKIDCAEFVPTVVRNLMEYLENSEKNLNFMQIVIVGSDSWYMNEYNQLQSFAASETRVINSYGVTEATIDSSYFESKKTDISGEHIVPIGSPFNNIEMYILDNHQQLVPIGVSGELCIAGAGIARGYLNHPQLTAAKFINNPFGEGKIYKTGDLARYLPDGQIELIGRIDNQVKIRGFRIELGEIEANLTQHPLINEVVVIVAKNNQENQYLVAYVITHLHKRIAIREIKEFLGQRLPAYMIPIAFVFLEEFPLTANGKINRQALPKADLSANMNHEFIAPRNEIEKKLALIWQEVLGIGIEKIGINDNFFNLGGHSLLATQVISRIRHTFSVELPLRKLFEYSTIGEISLSLERIKKAQNFTLQGTEIDDYPLPAIKPINKDTLQPLSFAQERLWFLNQLEGSSFTYNLCYTLKIEGNLELEFLEKSFQHLIARHETLHTCFAESNGKPYVKIEKPWHLEIPIFDLSNLSATEKSRQLKKLRETEARQTFNLNQIPLLKVKLVKYGARYYFLVLTIHHIIADAWSLEVLRNNLWTIYESLRQEKENPLPPLTIQYSDFAVWQRQWLRGKTFAHQLNYWQQQLNNIPPLLDLPTDYPRPPRQTYQGCLYSSEINHQLTEKINQLNGRYGTTIFMFLLSALGILLSRYSNQEDIVIGTPIANRRRKELESLIGFFANSLPLRLNLDNNLNFLQFLTQVKQTTLDAYENQDIPFEKLVEELQPERSLSYHPLFQVMLVLNNTPQNLKQITDLDISLYHPEDNQLQTAKFDLLLYVEAKEDGLEAIWEYNTDLFSRETITRLTDNFLVLLEGIIQQPTTPIKNLPILSPSETQKILFDWNNTQLDYPRDKCLHQLFEHQVEKTPDAIALVFEEKKLTYRELNEKANQLSHYLQKLEVKREKLIGICLKRSLEMIIGLLAILKAGCAYIPLDSNYPTERLKLMVEDANIDILLTQKSLLNQLPSSMSNVVCLDEENLFEREDKINPPAITSSSNLAYVIYTSGSTGKPKGVQIPHSNVINVLTSIQNHLQVSHKDIILSLASFSFDISVAEIFLPLINGGQLIIPTEETTKDAEKLKSLINQSKPTIIDATPTTWKLLQTVNWQGHEKLKIISTGEKLPSALADYLLAQNKSLWNIYGPTECTIWSLIYPITKSDQVLIGKPLANTQAYILNQFQQPTPVGVVGELHIAGDGLARGYLNRPKLTAEKFINNPFGEGKLYKTGDLARYLPDGNIEFLGRIDNQVKIRGFRLELAEIEANLGQHPHIQEAVVISQENTTGDTYIVGFIIFQLGIATKDMAAKIKEIRQFLRTKLPEYMIPNLFVSLEAFPLTPNGKIDRKALLEYDLEENRHQEFVAPRNEIETKLVHIWQQVLKIDKIGIHDNFFALGGHSLLAVQIITRIRKAFKLELPLSYLFESPTIIELGERLSNFYLAKSIKTISTKQDRERGQI